MTQHTSLDYNTLKKQLDRRQAVNVAHNTIVINDGLGSFSLLYHGNRIAELKPDQTVVLYNQGYKTPTTKLRLNWLLHPLGLSLYQENFIWYIFRYTDPDNNPVKVKFSEGMIISPKDRIIVTDATYNDRESRIEFNHPDRECITLY